MGTAPEPFVDDFLAHYGVKGMKWGVVRSTDGSQKSFNKSSEKFYATKDAEQLKAEADLKHKAQLSIVNPTKVGDGDDLQVSDLKSGRLTRNQKIALGVGAAVVVAGVAYYGHQKLGVSKAPRMTEDESRHSILAKKRDAELDGLFGDNGVRSSGYYKDGIKLGELIHPQFGGLINKKAFDRPEFTIPKTTSFQRLSRGAETGEDYDKGTYATFLSHDNANYGDSVEFGRSPYRINFNSSGDVRVPSLTSVLKTVKSVGGANGKTLSDDEAFAAYHKMSGGSWRDETSSKVISSLKKQGYSALVDDMDAGYLGDLPLVFFGKPTNLTAKNRGYEDRLVDEQNFTFPSGRYA